MSIETWIEEFYPVKASKDMTDIEACEHGILKWTGTLDCNLTKHNVDFDTVETEVGLNAGDCALCLKYIETECQFYCPLADTLNCTSCGSTQSLRGVWRLAVGISKFASGRNPQPLIDALKETLDRLQLQKKCNEQ